MKFVRANSLFLVDFESLFYDVKLETQKLAYFTKNKLKKRELLHYMVLTTIEKIFNFYESVSEANGLVVFVLSKEFLDKLLNADSKSNLVNFKRFVKIISKEMGFNFHVADDNFNRFSFEIENDFFLVDDLVNKSHHLATILPKICKSIKKFEFSQLNKELAENINAQLRLCGVSC